jgi:toxin-antitoxin system PIN domain toxin
MYLLDANILIALGDPAHVHHPRCQTWFQSIAGSPWATCALTQNAFLRIMSAVSYQTVQGGPEILRQLLTQICGLPGHQFWNDSISLLDDKMFPQLPKSKDLTDVYLLGLAVANNAKLVTLDARIDAKLVVGGPASYLLIP